MKRLVLFTLVATACATLSRAQVIEKGKKILGGSVNLDLSFSKDTFSNSAAKDFSTFSISLSPTYGKAIRNNLVFGYGLNLGFTTSQQESREAEDKFRGYNIGGSVFLEKFFDLGKSFYVSGKTATGLHYNRLKQRSYFQNTIVSGSRTSLYSVRLELVPSLGYAINKNFLVQMNLNDFVSLGYSMEKTTPQSPNTNTYVKRSLVYLSSSVNNAKLLNNISFGFRWILN